MKRGAKRDKKEKNSKGLSTIVATLLIILVTIVAVAIIWIVVRNVLQSNSEQVNLGKFTLSLDIKSIARDVSTNTMYVKIKRNSGEGNLSGFEFIIKDKQSSEIVETDLSLAELEEKTFTVVLSPDMNISNAQKVSIAPIFISSSGKEIIGNIADEYIFSNNPVINQPTCIPICAGKSCGDDGCEGSCGNCLNGKSCVNNACADYQIDSCGSLVVPNSVYILNKSVSSSGTCFTISAQNITLDCDSYQITYSTGGAANTYGIYTSQFKTTVKNCDVIDGNWVSSQYTRYGIYFDSNDNSTLLNNFVNASNSLGIYIHNGANFNTLTNNIGISDAYDGISLDFSNNNILTSNTGMSNWDVGISMLASNNSVLTNNIGKCTDYADINNICAGIVITSTSNNRLINNIGKGNAWYGIAISYSNNNILTNNNGTSNMDMGIELISLRDSTLIGNTGTSNHNTGIDFSYSSINNVLTNNIGRSLQGSQGISLHHNASNNILTNNTGIGGDQPGIFIYTYSNNNTLINNTARSNTNSAATIYTSLNNTLIGQTAIGGVYGLYIYQSNNTASINCNVITGSTQNIFISPDSFGSTFTNCPY